MREINFSLPVEGKYKYSDEENSIEYIAYSEKEIRYKERYKIKNSRPVNSVFRSPGLPVCRSEKIQIK